MGDYKPACGVSLCIRERLAFDFGEPANQELSRGSGSHVRWRTGLPVLILNRVDLPMLYSLQ
jgi:hypothetical protein